MGITGAGMKASNGSSDGSKKVTMMNKLLGYGGAMVVAAGVLLSGPAKADVIYQDSVTTAGLQSIPGGLGMDFTVNQSIQVTALGAFDNGNNANLAGAQQTGVTIGIFNINTGLLVGPSAFFNAGGLYTQIGADAFQSVAPFVLGPGTYSIVSLNADNFNSQTGPNPFQTLDNLNGAITFVGTGRFGTLNFALPPNSDFQTIPNPYMAGTFQAIVASVPEPATLTLFASCLGALGLLGWRRKRKAQAA
jgi:hypothetical protein